jgi:hypothetical protein
MFGLERKQTGDDLPIFVHAVTGDKAFQAAERLWQENARLMYIDKTNRKEFVRFTYAKPDCTAWLQRDEGRAGVFELILHWKDNDATEVFVLTPQSGGQSAAANERLEAVLQAMLTTPSVVPANQQK